MAQSDVENKLETFLHNYADVEAGNFSVEEGIGLDCRCVGLDLQTREINKANEVC